MKKSTLTPTAWARASWAPTAWALTALALMATVTSAAIGGVPAAAARSGAAQPFATGNSAQPDRPITVPLVTGDSVRLSGPAGRMTATAQPRPGGPAIQLTVTGKADGVQRIIALPADVARLGGAVDRGLFDVTWLAAHGLNTKDAKLPVIVQYAADPSKQADPSKRFAGATVVRTNPDHTAELSVDLSQAASFWSAVAPGGRLSSGIARIWLKDHILGYATRPGAAVRPGTAAYPVTVTVHLAADRDHQVFLCNAIRTTMCVMYVSLYAVTGPAAGQSFDANLLGCADLDPCTTYGWQANVPPGTYWVNGWASFSRDALAQNVKLEEPELTVAGATDFTFEVGDAKEMSVATPRPSSAYDVMVQDTRTLPDGQYVSNLMFGAYGYHQSWVTPSRRTTVGQFRLETGWILGPDPITMSTGGSRGSTPLHPFYPQYASLPGFPLYRLAARGTAGVVAAGEGSEADFAKVNARGKLVLLTVDSSTGLRCVGSSMGTVTSRQIQNAINAGAVGVLMDPETPAVTPGEFCQLPLTGEWGGSDDPVPALPFVSVTPSDAAALRAGLAKGPVSIAYADGGPPQEVYDLKFYQQGGVSADQRYAVQPAGLTPVRANLHTDTADPALDVRFSSSFQPGQFLTGGAVYAAAAPSSLTVYTGPVSPEVVHREEVESPTFYQSGLHVYADTERRTQDWMARPLVPGSPADVPDVLDAQPASWGTALNPVALCSYCRQGNSFYPIGYLESDRSLSSGLYGYDSTSAHLYRSGTELPQGRIAGLAMYTLPAERSAYRLVTDYHLDTFGEVHTQWDFTSAAPAVDKPGKGNTCVGTLVSQSDDPCAADPLVFVAYHLGNDPARGFTVEAYHQDAQAPAVTTVQVWTSTDDGAQWTPARVRPTRDGYTVTPSVRGTGALSVRVVAVDAAGNRVDQTILQAVRLS